MIYLYNKTDGIVNIEITKFPDGENLVNLPSQEDGTVVWQYESDEELFSILQLSSKYKKLYVPYLPHARQDRETNEGKNINAGRLLNRILLERYDKVFCLDIHSDKNMYVKIRSGEGNCYIDSLPSANIYANFLEQKYDYIVGPDAGSEKRTKKWGSHLYTNYFLCSKTRDTKTGKLSSPKIPEDIDLVGKSLLIVDDICTGGYTFIQLGKVLKEHGAAKIDLWVSHGSFTKGLEVFDGIIDHIYTTDSICKIKHEKLTVCSCLEAYKYYSTVIRE